MTTDSTAISAILDFEEFIKTDDIISHSNQNTVRGIISRVTGSLSFIASLCIIIHILRSHYGLSTTYHRLVLGLSLGDVAFSFFGYVLGATMVPKEYDYVIKGARGNQATCNFQGFLFLFGSAIALSYNMSICFYYLAIVTYNKKDDYIRTKLEPWFHAISILLSLAAVAPILAIDGFNADGNQCWFVPNNELPHCWGLDSGEIRDGFTIPCGRGDGKEHPTLRKFLKILMNGLLLATPIVIVVTMTLMHRTVCEVEKKIRKYGVGALRLRSRARNINIVSNDGNAPTSSESGAPPAHRNNKPFLQLLQSIFGKLPCIKNSRGKGLSRSRLNKVASQKRIILKRAAGYVVAYTVSWIPFIIYEFSIARPTLALGYALAICTPLQGVFNFFAFLQPKIIAAKNKKRRGAQNGPRNSGDNGISWCQAFVKAYMSKGPRRRTAGSRYSHSTTRNGISRKTFSLSGVFRKLKNSATVLLRKLNTTMRYAEGAGAATREQEIRPSPNLGQGGNIVLFDVASCNDNSEIPPHIIRQVHSRNAHVPLVLAEEGQVDLREEESGDEQ